MTCNDLNAFFIMQILKQSCTEILTVEPSSVCVNRKHFKRVLQISEVDEIVRVYVVVDLGVDLGERPEVLLMSSSGLHTTESFDIVLKGNGFTLGKKVLCSFIVDGVTYRMYCYKVQMLISVLSLGLYDTACLSCIMQDVLDTPFLQDVMLWLNSCMTSHSFI